MAKLKTYFDFAENDYAYACAFLDNEHMVNRMSNVILSSFHQTVEKCLKHVIDSSCSNDCDKDNEYMHSHNLTKLLRRVSDIVEIDMTPAESRWLGEFYFTARYPGDFEFEATSEDVMEAYDIASRVRLSVIEFNSSLNHIHSVENLRKENPVELLRHGAYRINK